MAIGLAPKANLVALVLALLLCGLRTNKPAGLVAAGIFSVVGLLLDGAAHTLGSLVLTWQPLIAIHQAIYDMPLGPWTGLNHTVVVGQLLFAVYLAWPVYEIAFRVASRVQEPLRRWLMKYRITRWLWGAEIGTRWDLAS
jgi:uncharacterized protein (TIGR03546 family)